jgi:hypothetical protein
MRGSKERATQHTPLVAAVPADGSPLPRRRWRFPVPGQITTVAAAESSPPGTADWAMAGGLLGAWYATPIATTVGAAATLNADLVRPRT